MDKSHSFLFIIGLNRLKSTEWTPHSDSSNLVVESSNLSGGARYCPARGGPARMEVMQSLEHIKMLQMLLARLERVSVDSYWAHRASGVRGSLLRNLEMLEAGQPVNPAGLQSVLDQAFRILERAARERAR